MRIHRELPRANHGVEDYLQQLKDLSSDADSKLQLAVGEFQARQAADTNPNLDEYTSRFSDISEQLRSKLSELVSGAEQHDRLPATQTFITDQTVGDRQLGRYRLERVLGEGAYGRVYLAYDEELQRQVAIKVPTAERFQQPELGASIQESPWPGGSRVWSELVRCGQLLSLVDVGAGFG